MRVVRILYLRYDLLEVFNLWRGILTKITLLSRMKFLRQAKNHDFISAVATPPNLFVVCTVKFVLEGVPTTTRQPIASYRFNSLFSGM